MKIAVLDLTTHPEPLLSGFPRVATQIIDWLKPALPEAEFLAVDVADAGEGLPSTDHFDGLIISGSEFGVYDDLDWLDPLRQLLVASKLERKPMYGICFGHQIMADVFGGKAEKAKIGNVVGARRFEFLGQQVDAFVWHKDQVTEVPPNATVTAHSDHCPVAALAYDFPAESVQFHPEYKEEHLRELFDVSRDEFLTGQEADQAIASFETATVPSEMMSKKAAVFFRSHI